jgi:hypothetical protein
MAPQIAKISQFIPLIKWKDEYFLPLPIYEMPGQLKVYFSPQERRIK